MVKVQQDAFASMISATNVTAKDVKVGDRRIGEIAFFGQRTTASAPDPIERRPRWPTSIAEPAGPGVEHVGTPGSLRWGPGRQHVAAYLRGATPRLLSRTIVNGS